MMEPDDPREHIQEELVAALKRLRWLLTGLRMGGMRDFPVSPASRIGPAAGEAVPELVRDEAPCVPEVRFVQKREPSAPLPDLAPPEAAAPLPRPDAEQTLIAIRKELGECRRCRLHEGRSKLVFADGSPSARLVFVGEGPGFDEDRQGLPFVGRAGKLLDKMIAAIGFARKDVYICNVVKCRPPNNRTPNPDEIEVCSPYLFKQLDAIRPRVICALGACAAQTLLGNARPISQLRGKPNQWRGIPLVCTYHPAYLLRTPAQKAATWQDLLEVLRLLQGEGERVKRRNSA